MITDLPTAPSSGRRWNGAKQEWEHASSHWNDYSRDSLVRFAGWIADGVDNPSEEEGGTRSWRNLEPILFYSFIALCNYANNQSDCFISA